MTGVNLTDIDIIYLLWHLFYRSSSLSQFDTTKRITMAAVNTGLRMKEQFIIDAFKVCRRSFELSRVRSGRRCGHDLCLFTSRHPFPVLILRYTCNHQGSTRPIVGHMCLVSRSLLMLAHPTQRTYASRLECKRKRRTSEITVDNSI